MAVLLSLSQAVPSEFDLAKVLFSLTLREDTFVVFYVTTVEFKPFKEIKEARKGIPLSAHA